MSLRRPSEKTSAMVGVAVAALAMLVLELVVSNLVVRWCPRGENCRQTGQVLFGLGLIVSFAVSVFVGFAARDIVARLAAPRSH
jgi:protein-S-isoprenylcysteine O-methyltransferase Ste14